MYQWYAVREDMGTMLLNIFIMELDDWTELIIRKFVDDIKLGEILDISKRMGCPQQHCRARETCWQEIQWVQQREMRRIPCTMLDQELSSWKAGLQRRTLRFWWTRRWTWANDVLLQHSGLPTALWAEWGEQVKARNLSPLLHTGEAHPDSCSSGPLMTRHTWTYRRQHCRTTKMMKGWSLCHEERLAVLGLFSLDSTILRGILSMCIKCLMGRYKK